MNPQAAKEKLFKLFDISQNGMYILMSSNFHNFELGMHSIKNNTEIEYLVYQAMIVCNEFLKIGAQTICILHT